MAQDLSDLLAGNAVPQHLRGRGMAKEVSTFRRSFDTSTSQSPLHHVRDTIAREERLKRGNVPTKDTIQRVDRRPTLQILEDRLTDVLGKR